MFDRVQSVLSACRELAESAAEAVGTVLDHPTAPDVGPVREHRRIWSRGGHAAIEVRGLSAATDGADGARAKLLADALRRSLSGLRGVRWAEVNAVTAQVLVAFDEGHVDVGGLVDAVRGVESDYGTRDEGFSWSKPAHPADSAPLAANWVAFAADIAGIGAGFAGRLGRLGRLAPLPAAVRIPLTLLDSYPRLRAELEKRIGPLGADVLLAVANSAVFGLTDGPSRPAVDAVYRLLLAGELQARMAAWTDRYKDLVCDPETSAAGPTAGRPRPRDLPPGPVETYSDRMAGGSLAAAIGVLAATRDPGRAADALTGSVPKPAHLGREGFAAVLGRDLARGGAVPMDRSVFRRLDRVSAIVIDSGVLIGSRPQVLSATAAPASEETAEAADARAWRAANAVLGKLSADDLRGPGPWQHGDYQLTRQPAQAEGEPGGADSTGGPDGPDSPEGLRLLVIGAGGGRRLGEVIVGCEPDPLAEAVLTAAHREGWRLHLTRHASIAGLVGRADEVVSADLTAHVRELQADERVVLLIATGANDGNSALAAADVAVGYFRECDQEAVGWAADILCGPGLGEVWRVLRAAGRARSVSEHAVALAGSGAALGVLEAAVSRRGGALSSLSPVPIPRLPVRPLQALSLTSLALGAYSARALAREELPAPVHRTPWHALPADEVLSRLDAEREAEPAPGPGGQAAGGQGWQDRLAFVTPPPVAAMARGSADLGRAVFTELRDPLTPVLLTGAAASAMLGSSLDAGLVSGVMVGNAMVSGAQRLVTERALRQLLVSEQRCARRLRRSPGEPVPGDPDESDTDLVPAEELRPGDVIVLRPNDVVPADARLLTAASLEVDESALTGESLPVAKDTAPTVAAHLSERTSMVYDATTVVTGDAVAVVTAAGEATEAGRAGTAAAAQAAPAGGVSAQLSDLTSAALPATGVGGLAVTALGMLRGVPVRDALSAGVAVAVAAVPEGLPLVSTVAQLAAARRLSRRGVLVRSPRTIEALGRVDAICFDKTGTLTEGRLELAALAAPGCAAGDADPGDPGDDLGRDCDQGRHLLRAAARACPPPGALISHATDQAIVDAVKDEDDNGWELLTELPFENNRGFSAALGRACERLTLAVKGAPEVLLDRCSSVVAGDAGEPAPLTADRRGAAESVIAGLAGRGLRVLAVAEATPGDEAAGTDADGIENLASDLTLLGYVAIADVLRPDAKDVVNRLAVAGVRPVMITGDHPETASAIARRVAIPGADQVLTGAELDGMTERERLDRVAECGVFARVTPEHKLRIIADLRRAGRVVAMVGDGANDAAAIRLADVGIGVAARGSTAARNSSDLVLTEGDIGRISDSLWEGRALWHSVRNAVSILVGGNAGEVTFMVLGTAIGGRSPLNTRQLLLVNMLTDMFPALAVASTRPAGAADGDGAVPAPAALTLTGPLGKSIAIRGGATAMGGTLAWAGGRLTGRARRAPTMGLASVVGTQLAQTVVTGGRSPAIIGTSAASAAVLVLVVNTPGVSQFFGCTPLGPVDWGIVCASAATATAASLAAPRLLPQLRDASDE